MRRTYENSDDHEESIRVSVVWSVESPSGTMLVCKSSSVSTAGSVPVKLKYGESVLELDDRFTYTENPIITDVRPLTAFHRSIASRLLVSIIIRSFFTIPLVVNKTRWAGQSPTWGRPAPQFQVQNKFRYSKFLSRQCEQTTPKTVS